MTMGSAIRAGRAFVEILGDARGLNKAMDSVRDRATQLSGELKRVGATTAGMGAAIVAPIALAVNRAGSFAEDLSKFDVVFGENADSVRQWGDEYAKQVGRSRGLLTKMLAEAQDTLGPMAQLAGVDPANAIEMSKTVAQLAIDLASFNNMTDEEAFDSLIRGLVVSTTNLRKFGVVANEAFVKQRALSMGFDVENLTAYEKALAVMNITQEATTSAQGDAIRTAESYANQMKALRAAIDDAAVELGDVFLPQATSMVAAMKDGIQIVSQFAGENTVLAQALGAVGAVMLGGGMALIIGGQLTSSLVAMTNALQAGGLAATATAGGIVALTTAVGLYAIGVFDLIKELRDLEEQQKAINRLFAEGTEAASKLPKAQRDQQAETIRGQIEELNKRRGVVLGRIKDPGTGQKFTDNFWDVVAGGTPDVFKSIDQQELDTIDSTLDNLRKRLDAILQADTSGPASVPEKAKDAVKQAADSATEDVKSAVDEMQSAIKEQLDAIGQQVPDFAMPDVDVRQQQFARLRSASARSASLSNQEFYRFGQKSDPMKKLEDIAGQQLDRLNAIADNTKPGETLSI